MAVQLVLSVFGTVSLEQLFQSVLNELLRGRVFQVLNAYLEVQFVEFWVVVVLLKLLEKGSLVQ